MRKMGLSPGSNIEQKEHLAEKRREYQKRYGFERLNDWDVAEIEEAEAAQGKCQECQGQCAFNGNRYSSPFVENYQGRLYIRYKKCRYGMLGQMKNNCRLAKIPMRYAGKDFSDYEVTEQNREAVQMARWYVSQTPPCSLYYYGGVGSGKTFLASLIAQRFMSRGKRVVFGDVPELMNEIKATFDSKEESASEVLRKYCECDLLVMDDVGAGQLTAWTVGKLYELINTRYNNGKPMILTSNLSLNELETRLERFDEYAGKRLVSRLYDLCEVAYFGEVDRRRRK